MCIAGVKPSGTEYGHTTAIPIFTPMVTFEEYQKLALSFPDTEELPHFEKPSFRYKKKIFATYWEKENRAMLKLTPVEQSVYCSYDKSIFFPVNGTWGQQGATLVELKKVRKDVFKEALALAYNGVASKK
jgi:hypothetical protein